MLLLFTADLAEETMLLPEYQHLDTHRFFHIMKLRTIQPPVVGIKLWGKLLIVMLLVSTMEHQVVTQPLTPVIF